MFPPVSFRARAALAGAALVLGACSFDGHPGAANITCNAEAPQCPKGFRCVVALGRCVDEASVDDTGPTLVPQLTRLTLVPPRGVPLSSVTRLGLQGRALISFTADEALGVPPELASSPPLDCTARAMGVTAFELDCGLAAGTGAFTGAATLSLKLTDVSGNVSQLPLDALSLVVDTEPPAPPAVDTEGQVVFSRRPWGDLDAGPARRLLVSGSGGEAGVTVVASSGSAQLGLSDVAPDGTFGIDVGTLDVDQPSLEFFDQAGNASGPRAIRDVEWVATLGGKIPDDVTLNPNRLQAVSVHGESALRPDGPEPDVSGCMVADGLGPLASGGATWRRRSPLATSTSITLSPPVLVADPLRAKVVRITTTLIGGTRETVHEWTGEDWAQITPQDPEFDGNPAPRISTAAFYDPMRRELLSFGGGVAQSFGTLPGFVVGDTWTWNGSSWRQVSPATAPPARMEHAMAWDARAKVGLLFGGRGADGGCFGDTWAWTGSSWVELDAGTPPSPRAQHAMAWDARRQQVLLFGGGTLDGGCSAELFAWDGRAWVLVDAGPPGPAARCHPAMTGTPDGRLFVAGGTPGFSSVSSGGPSPFQDLWELDDGWTQLLQDAGPLGYSAGVVWDAPRSQLLVTPRRLTSPTYALAGDGGLAVALTPSPSAPTGRVVPGLATVADGGVMLYGGGTSSLNNVTTYDAQTWLWNGTAWTLVHPGVQLDGGPLPDAGPTPGPRVRPVLNLEPSTQALLLYDPYGVPPLMWRFSDGAWAPLDLDGGPVDDAGARVEFAGVAPYGDALAFAGYLQNYTWHPLRGWEPLVSFPTLSFPSACAPTGDGGLMCVGEVCPPNTFGNGCSPVPSLLGERLQSGAWSTLPGPWPIASSPALALDPVRHRLELFGGYSGAQLNGATLELLDDGFAPMTLSDPEGDGVPVPRLGAALAWDSSRNRAVLFGGLDAISNSANYLDDLWELESADRRPALIFRVAVGAAGIRGDAEVRSVVLTASAGGLGTSAQSPVSGAEAALWRYGRWVRWAQNTSPLVAPGPLQASESGAEASRLVSEWPELLVAFTPTGGNAEEAARVLLDAVELRVRYRLPAQ